MMQENRNFKVGDYVVYDEVGDYSDVDPEANDYYDYLHEELYVRVNGKFLRGAVGIYGIVMDVHTKNSIEVQWHGTLQGNMGTVNLAHEDSIVRVHKVTSIYELKLYKDTALYKKTYGVLQ